MSDSRQLIQEAAVRLFNEHGYDKVSLRDIAREAGLAIGSLTYHYKKKEDLLEWILTDLHAGFTELLDWESRGEPRLAALLDLFAAAKRNQGRYPFYFRNIDSIMRDSDALRSENIAFENRLATYYARSIHELNEHGLTATPPTAPASIACSMVALHACWMTPASPAANGATNPLEIDAALAALLGCLIHPDKAKIYTRLCSERGIDLD